MEDFWAFSDILSMSYTIGDMIDQLTIANIRLWHIEEERRSLISQFEKAQGEEEIDTMQKITAIVDKTSKVNSERNSLIDDINRAIRTLLDETIPFELKASSLLGYGKNKLY
jgi:hypothetical protein